MIVRYRIIVVIFLMGFVFSPAVLAMPSLAPVENSTNVQHCLHQMSTNTNDNHSSKKECPAHCLVQNCHVAPVLLVNSLKALSHKETFVFHPKENFPFYKSPVPTNSGLQVWHPPKAIDFI